ncbi:MAG: hypothetical protein E7621_03595 [Ruminococcaceae bacterium]|nr:hypothetical protein [Oscillospiraceae bacterium]
MKNRILSLVLAVLCMISTIPYTSFAVSAADVDYSFRVLEPGEISKFEDPYAADGNFVINGVNLEITEFNGQTVKAFSKTADKITAVRGDETKEDYSLNLYSYDELYDSNGQLVRMYDAQYVVVEYYYDTTNRDENDTIGDDFTGNVMKFNTYSYNQNGTKNDIYVTCDATDEIVANEWATAVFNNKDAFNSTLNRPEVFYYENTDTYTLKQWALYPFGGEKGLQMFKGDVFYIKSIRFCSYDPSNPPSEEREVIFYLTQNDYLEDEPAQGRFLKLEGTKDLDTFVFPNPEDEDSGFERIEGQKFSHWLRIDYGTKHYPGEVYSIVDGNDAYFSGVYIKPQTITFNYNGSKLYLDDCYRNDTIIIPELPEDAVDPQNAKFYGWKDNIEGKIYMPGDEYLYSDIRVGFDAVYSNLCEVKFTANGIDPIIRKWYENSYYELPAGVEAPEGKVFAGWTAGGVRYSAGAKYYFTGEYLEFTASFVEPSIIYYSSTGSIDGITDKVYTNVADADAAINRAGGVGTIYVSGDLAMLEGTFTFASADIKFIGYDEDATVTLNTNNHVTIESQERTKITFDDIEIVRGKGGNDENWLQLRNVDLVFGDNCDFATATFNDWQGNPVERGLYIANIITGDNYTAEIDGQVYIDVLSPLGGYGDSHSSTADYKFVVNGGTVKNIYLVANNGNYWGTPSVVNGNVDVIINGGDISNLVLGSNRGDKLEGNAVVTINGGNIQNLYYGNGDVYNSARNGSIKNIVLVYNLKEILENNYSIPAIAKTEHQNEVQNSVVIVNNAELAANVPELDVADYNIQVRGGKAVAVFVDDNVLFNVEFDSDVDYVVLANGEAVAPNSDGLYSFEKGTTLVQYRAVSSQTVTFNYNDKSFEQSWFAGEDVQMPQLPDDAVIPDEKLFKGWKAGDAVYAAGSEYFFTGEHLEFTAEFVEAAKVYYSASGVIEGVSEKVYTTLAEADAAIAHAGGVGTVFVSGNLPILEGTYTFASEDIKIVGYDANATVTLSTNNHIIFTTGTKSEITFDDIKIIRGKGNVDENWLQLKNVNLVFGDGCEFSTATFKNWQQLDVERGLYIANINTGSGFSAEIGGQVYVDILAPLGGWIDGAHTANGDFRFVVNGGTVKNLSLVAYNDNQYAQPSVVTGNVDVEINGGTVSDLYLGSRKADKLVGNAVVTINGGTVENIYYGSGTYNSAQSGSVKNLALVYNVKEILANQSAIPAITMRDNQNDVQNSVFVVNNSELLETVPTLDIADYNIQVRGGKATPVFDGNNVYFSIEADADGAGAIYANGKAVTANDDGLYAFEKGTTLIRFSTSAPKTVTFTYGNKSFEKSWFEGDTVMIPGLPADAVIPDGFEFKGWKAGETLYTSNSDFVFDGSVLEFAAEFGEEAVKVIYLNPQSGNDSRDGYTQATAIKSIDEVNRRLSVLTGNKATVEIIGTLSAEWLSLPAFSGVLTLQGGTIKWSGGLNLNSDTVFKNINLYADGGWKYIATEMYDLTFDTGVTEASGSQGLYIHAGLSDNNMNGDLKVVLKSGDIKEFRVGPYYNATGTSKVWNGNFELIVDGATIGKIEHGDSWGSTTEGGFSINGTEKFIIKSGSVGYMNTHKLSKITGGILVYDYCHLNFEFNNWDAHNINIYRFNVYGDVNPVSFANGKFTTDKPARVIGQYTDMQGTAEFTGLTAGTYSIYPREMSFTGAQIRLDDPAALRFIFKVSGASSAAKANYGMLVYPTALLGDDILTHALVGEGKAKDIDVEKIYAEDSTSFSFSLAIYNIKNTAAGYQKEFTVVPYIIEADGSYSYGEAQSLSLYDVAKEATGTDAQNDFIKNIITTVESSAN